MTIALYVIEIIAYTIFGSGEEQQWNRTGEIPTYFEEGTPLKSAAGEETNSYTVNKQMNANWMFIAKERARDAMLVLDQSVTGEIVKLPLN